MNRVLFLLTVLVLLTAGIYSSVWRFGTIDYDDNDCLDPGSFVHQGLTPATVRDSFSTYLIGNYSPLVSLSFCLDQSLFHLRPGAMHVENVLLHLIAGLLLWRFLFLASGRLELSFAVAALFLVHPMHVESVAWISERKDTLSTPLLLAAMIAYIHYCRMDHPRRWIAYAAMLVLFALSLLSKSMGVTMPAVLLLIDVWPLRRRPRIAWRLLVLEKLPLVALSIAAAVMAGFAQRSAGATSSLSELTFLDRITNALVCYTIYILKLIVPENLAVFYQHPWERPWPAVIAASGLLILITWLFIRQRKRRPYLLIGWLWFLGTLVPVIGLVQVGAQAMADRYSYFPSIGLFIAAVWFFAEALRSTALKAVALTAILLAFSITAWKQVSYWRDTETLFSHAVAVTDVNPPAQVILGNLAYSRGDLNTARSHYEKALEVFTNARAYNGLGNCYYNSDLDRAIGYYEKAIDANPRLAMYHVNLANALWMKGDTQQELHEAHMAVQLDPSYGPAQLALKNIQAGPYHKPAH